MSPMSSPGKQDPSQSNGRPASSVVVALVQMSGHASKQHNVDKALARIGEAAAAGANIVCLQELFAGQYPCQSEDHSRFDQAEPIPGPTSEALAAAVDVDNRRGLIAVEANRRIGQERPGHGEAAVLADNVRAGLLAQPYAVAPASHRRARARVRAFATARPSTSTCGDPSPRWWCLPS